MYSDYLYRETVATVDRFPNTVFFSRQGIIFGGRHSQVGCYRQMAMKTGLTVFTSIEIKATTSHSVISAESLANQRLIPVEA